MAIGNFYIGLRWKSVPIIWVSLGWGSGFSFHCLPLPLEALQRFKVWLYEFSEGNLGMLKSGFSAVCLSVARASVLLCLAIVVVSAPSVAQVLYGGITGLVTDPASAAVPGANVKIHSRATGLVREVSTDFGGRYNFPSLLPGSYEVQVSASGFRTSKTDDLDVKVNSVARLDVRLEIGQVSEQVTVSSTAALLQTDKSETRAEINSKEISTLPVSRFRNYQALINLVPGATPGVLDSPIDLAVRPYSTNVNGGFTTSNTTRIDGAASVNVWTPNATTYVPPTDTIETVNITTGSFDAEQGLAGASAVTVVTKSGTNEYHGSAYEYHDNQRLKSRPFFMPSTQKKPVQTLNIFGATLGGAIIKNRLFYFGGFEGVRERTGGFGNFSLPTADIRTGNFSSYINPSNRAGTLYDPATGTGNGVGRTPFAGNIIPDSRINPISRKILALVPVPNMPGATNNFSRAASGIYDRDNYDLKINYTATSRLLVWGKYSRMNSDGGGQFALGEAGGPGVGGDPGNGHEVSQMVSGAMNYTITPTMLLDMTFGYSRRDQDVYGADHGRNYGTDDFGIPGTNGSDPRYSGFPAINFATYTGYGQLATYMPIFRNDRSFTYTNNLSYIRGAHELKFGFDLVRHQLNHWQPTGASARGGFFFNGNVTALSGGAAPNQYNSFGQFLLGLPGTVQKGLVNYLMTGREWQFGWYARDRWQVTRRLTLNLGLRVEHFPLMTRAETGLERWDVSTNQLFIGGRGNNPLNAGISTDSLLFAPRIGVTYRATDKTVIRAGYGLTYDPLPFSRPLRGMYPYQTSVSYVNALNFLPYNSLTEGIPSIATPDISSGILSVPTNVSMRTPGSKINRGYFQSWNLTVERQLPWQIVGTVGYVGSQITNQLVDQDLNAVGPGVGVVGMPFYQKYGRNSTVAYWDGWLSGNYHSLQTSLNKRLSDGLFLKGAYTWSKAINMTDSDGWASLSYNWLPTLRRNYAPASYDRTHNFQLAFLYELPFGKNKPLAKSGAAALLLGGWQVNGSVYAYTGTPFTLTASGASLNAPGNAQNPDQVLLDVVKLGGVGPGSPYFNPAAFKPVTETRFGTSGRNILRRPGIAGLDASLFRSINITEGLKLDIRAEAFNLTNTPQFGQPNASVTGSNFMWITSAGGERQLRFGARLAF